MAVAYVESICGYPYMQKERIAQEFDISPNTVRNRLHEIEEKEHDRYGDYAVIRDGKILLINMLVFLDYMTYRRRLLDKNARKYVPEFSPEKVARMVGWSNRTILEEDMSQ